MPPRRRPRPRDIGLDDGEVVVEDEMDVVVESVGEEIGCGDGDNFESWGDDSGDSTNGGGGGGAGGNGGRVK